MKFLPALLLFFLPNFLDAQSPATKKWQFGAFFGFENQNLDWRTPVRNPKPGSFAYNDRPKAGAAAGFLATRHFNQTLALRFSPGFSYNWNRLHFPNGEPDFFVKNYCFADLDFPVHFVVTNPPGKFPLRGSFLFGGRFSQNLFENGSGGVKIYGQRFAVDLGIGVLARLKKLNFQPEMVYSFGLNNIHDAAETPENWNIGKMVRDRLAVRILVFFNGNGG